MKQSQFIRLPDGQIVNKNHITTIEAKPCEKQIWLWLSNELVLEVDCKDHNDTLEQKQLIEDQLLKSSSGLEHDYL